MVFENACGERRLPKGNISTIARPSKSGIKILLQEAHTN
jgi:hypothetical protein